MLSYIFRSFLSILCCLSFFLTAGAQRLQFQHQTVNVGTALWRKPVTATFHFKNRDKNPIEITAVDAGCDCLKPTWTQGPIERGEEGDISVTYNASLLGHFDRYIHVYTHQSAKPIRLRMKGVVSTGEKTSVADLYPVRIGDIGLSTNDLVFPDVTTADSVTARIEIWNDSKEVFTPQLMHLPPYITAVYRPQMLARGRRGYIDLTLHGNQLKDMGLTQTRIYLARYSGDKVSPENEIDLSAVLLPDAASFGTSLTEPRIQLSTNELNLGRLGKKKKLTGSVTISNVGNGVLQLSAIQVFNSALQVVVPKRELAPGETITMKITLLAKYLPTSKSKPRVLIISNDATHLKQTVDIDFQ